MIDTCTIRLEDAKKTALCGKSLAFCMYDVPIDIMLSGPVGAGKTTFVQSFAEALGVAEPVPSPTYALEQRYDTSRGYPFLHLDLYRIAPNRVSETLAQSDSHDGIRCIEWADRMKESDHAGHGRISIALEELETGRACTVAFNDAVWPSRETILQWRKEVMLPTHIATHCDVVAEFAVRCADVLSVSGIIVRPLLLRRAAELHDLLRFLDFRPGAAPEGMINDRKSLETWEKWKERYSGMKHEQACAVFLRERKLDAVATVVETHGLVSPMPQRKTIEQKILFYADKRVMMDRVVTLEERFEDFKKRYSGGILTEQARLWREEADVAERELFPEGVPI